MVQKIPLRPSRFVEHQLVTAILNGTYPPGTALPNERTLAKNFGVTRPTLRETLHRLAAMGWLTIRHGKPTEVNHYWKTGGMGILGTLAQYSNTLSDGFVVHLLEVRSHLMPILAKLSAQKAPEVLLDYLADSKQLDDTAESYAGYDWDLQVLMAGHSANPIYTLMLNDFSSMYIALARRYFSDQEARRVSRRYYENLYRCISNGGKDIEEIVRITMEQAVTIWNRLNTLPGQ